MVLCGFDMSHGVSRVSIDSCSAQMRWMRITGVALNHFFSYLGTLLYIKFYYRPLNRIIIKISCPVSYFSSLKYSIFSKKLHRSRDLLLNWVKLCWIHEKSFVFRYYRISFLLSRNVKLFLLVFSQPNICTSNCIYNKQYNPINKMSRDRSSLKYISHNNKIWGTEYHPLYFHRSIFFHSYTEAHSITTMTGLFPSRFCVHVYSLLRHWSQRSFVPHRLRRSSQISYRDTILNP